MNDNKIPFDDATFNQLRQFAKESLGLGFSNNIGDDKLRARIREAWKNPFIVLFGETDPEVEVEPETTAPVKVNIKALGGGSSKNDPKVRMFFNEAEGAGGKRSIYFNVNNVPILLPRGVECDVPYRYYIAAKNAVKTIVEQDVNDEITERDVPAYPFQVISFPSKDEMKSWYMQEHESQYPPGKAPDMENVA